MALVTFPSATSTNHHGAATEKRLCSGGGDPDYIPYDNARSLELIRRCGDRRPAILRHTARTGVSEDHYG